MAIKKIFYNGGDKWKRRASTIINQLIDGGGSGSFVPLTRKVNGKSLENDISLTSSDVGAIPASEKGISVATLTDGKLTRSQMPYFSVVNGELCITYERT